MNRESSTNKVENFSLDSEKISDSMLERTSELRRMNEQPAENEKKKGKKGGKLIEGFQNLASLKMKIQFF